MALGLLLDIGGSGGAEKAQFGFVDLQRLVPALAIGQVIFALLFRPDQGHGGGIELLARYEIRDHAHRASGATVDRFAARDQLHGVAQACDAGHADRAAPTGEHAEFDLRKAELRLGTGRHDPPIAPDRQFGAAADAHAVDGCEAHVSRFGKPGEQLAAARGDGHGLLGRGILGGGEFAQVGAGDENAGFGRPEDQPGKVLATFELIQQRFQLFQYRLREYIGPFARRVEGNDGDIGFGPGQLQRWIGHTAIPSGSFQPRAALVKLSRLGADAKNFVSALLLPRRGRSRAHSMEKF